MRTTSILTATAIAGTLIALATGPVFAQGQNVGESIMNLGEDLENLGEDLAAILNLLEPKTIFVTSGSFSGNLIDEASALPGAPFADGLEAGDALCQNLADVDGSIVPEGEYVALLSNEDVNAAARLTPTIGPYVRPDGLPIAADFVALFSVDLFSDDFNLINPIGRDELGEVSFGVVWTGTFASGMGSGVDCLQWTSGDGGLQAGRIGFNGNVDARWLSVANQRCDVPSRLYCAQR